MKRALELAKWPSLGIFKRAIDILLAVSSLLLVTNSAWANTDPDSRLVCPSGLVVHLYVPTSPQAKILRSPEGSEFRVSPPLLTVTKSMVKSALISRYHAYSAPEDRERIRERRGLRETFFWVALELTGEGREQLNRALAGRHNADLVVACDTLVLIAGELGEEKAEGVNVLVNDVAEAAEQFARSFTSNVRWEQRTPASQ